MSQPVVMLSDPVMLRMGKRMEETQGWRVVHLWELKDEDRAQVRVVFYAGVTKVNAEVLKTLPNVGLVASVSAGYEGVDVGWCRAHGIEVTSGRGLNSEDVADHGLALLLAAWRNIIPSDLSVRENRWGDHKRPRHSLGGRKMGIVGLGAIGVATARRCEAFGMEVAWWGPNSKDAPWPRAESLMALAQDSDILYVASRADETNRRMISREVIEAVGPRGLIVNVARGSIIDEDELIAALRDGRLGAAALDVFVREPTPGERWKEVPNAVLTPHTGGSTLESTLRMMAVAIDNARLFLAGEPVTHSVAA